MAATASPLITETGPKIFVPTLYESPEPTNMPSKEQIEAWHELLSDFDAASNKSIYKQKGADPASFNGRCRFRPESLFPQHDVVLNKVTYRFNVIVLNGKRMKKAIGFFTRRKTPTPTCRSSSPSTPRNFSTCSSWLSEL